MIKQITEEEFNKMLTNWGANSQYKESQWKKLKECKCGELQNELSAKDFEELAEFAQCKIKLIKAREALKEIIDSKNVIVGDELARNLIVKNKSIAEKGYNDSK